MKMVKIYDLETKKLSEIPAAELAPGMVHAQIEGVGLVWIDGSKVNLSKEFKHPPFDKEARALLEQIKAALDEVRPMTLQAWEEGFRVDTNMEKELAIWVNIANAYKALGATAPPEQRREIFSLIVGCANYPREHVLEVVQLNHLSGKEARRLMDKIYSGNK